MMRPLLALAALLTVSAAPADWSATVTARADGAYVIGNPTARVKLVEWASYTCSHCAHFAEQSRAGLEGGLIRSGSTSLEVRHLIRDTLDFAAVAVARCGGPRGFPKRHHAIFTAQDRWTQQGATFLQANGAQLDQIARPVAFRRIADGAGLTAIGRANGLTAAQIDACFAPAALERISKLGDPPAGVTSTPSFYVNGQLVSGVDWAGLQPRLRAAGAR